MQLSDNIKRLLKAILFIIIFLLLTLLFNAAYELDESATEAMLTSYSNHSDLDTVFVGNSAGEMVDSDIFPVFQVIVLLICVLHLRDCRSL